MRLDNTKYKVYIYSIDDELSSESEPEDAEGRLVFLPEMEKHLRQTRIGGPGGLAAGAGVAPPIPRPILPNKDGELAGMQMVLYSEPSSLSIPQAHDSVRKAIIETRARAREKQHQHQQTKGPGESSSGGEQSLGVSPVTTAPRSGGPAAADQADPDAMDTD